MLQIRHCDIHVSVDGGAGSPLNTPNVHVHDTRRYWSLLGRKDGIHVWKRACGCCTWQQAACSLGSRSLFGVPSAQRHTWNPQKAEKQRARRIRGGKLERISYFTAGPQRPQASMWNSATAGSCRDNNPAQAATGRAPERWSRRGRFSFEHLPEGHYRPIKDSVSWKTTFRCLSPSRKQIWSFSNVERRRNMRKFKFMQSMLPTAAFQCK